MHRQHAAPALALLAVAAALTLAAGAAPAGAQTATPTEAPTDTPADGDGGNGTVGTVIEVSFADSLTDAQRQRAAGVIQARLAGSPGYNGTVRTTEEGLLLRVQPTAPPAVVDLLLQRGNVTVTARTPEVTGVTLFTNADVRGTGSLRPGSGAVVLPVYLTPGGAQNMSATLVRLNHTANPGQCDRANRTGYCLLVRLDGSVVNTAGITPRFAEVVAAGNFTGERGFAVATETLNPAVRLQVALAAGPLPAEATATSVENVTAFDDPGGTATPTADPPTTESDGSSTATPTDGSPSDSGPAAGDTTTGDGSPGFTPGALVLATLALAALAAQTLRS
jgi:hypothetical protein